MSGLVLKGALVEFMPTFLPVPAPNVIVFQYNPETMTHTWTQPEAGRATAGTEQGNPLAVKGVPGEAFSFTIAMDANDEIADGSAPTAALAEASGIYSRLAALEMLLYPTGVGPVRADRRGVGGHRVRPQQARRPARPAPSRSPSCRSRSSSGDPDASCRSG